MNSYDFTLKFAIPQLDRDELEDKLFEAGCDDALVGTGAAGRIALDFTREAITALNAVTSAIHDVKKAIPDARLIEVAPDLVGLTDIASVIGVSRQYARNLVFESDLYPLPIHTGNPDLWHLSDVLNWLIEVNRFTAPSVLMEIATISKTINSSRTSMGIDYEKIENLDFANVHWPN